MNLIELIESGNLKGVQKLFDSQSSHTIQQELVDDCVLEHSFLYHAVLHNQPDIIQFFLEKGADPLTPESLPLKGQCTLSLEDFEEVNETLSRISIGQLIHDRFFVKTYLEQSLMAKPEHPITREPLFLSDISLLPVQYTSVDLAARIGNTPALRLFIEKHELDWERLLPIAILHKQPDVLAFAMKYDRERFFQCLSTLTYEDTPLYKHFLNQGQVDAFFIMLPYLKQSPSIDSENLTRLLSQYLDTSSLSTLNTTIQQLKTYLSMDEIRTLVDIDAIVQTIYKEKPYREKEKSPLCYLYEDEYLELAELFLSAGYDINEIVVVKGNPDNTWFPLGHIVYSSVEKHKALDHLLQNPDLAINLKTATDKTALSYCLTAKSEWPLEKLLAVPDIEVNTVEDSGYTPLMIAIWANISLPSIKRLIDKGCDVNLSPTNVHNPLTIAMSQKNLPLINLLLENGALVGKKARRGYTGEDAPVIPYKNELKDIIKQEIQQLGQSISKKDYLIENEYYALLATLYPKQHHRLFPQQPHMHREVIQSAQLTHQEPSAPQRSNPPLLRRLGKLFSRKASPSTDQ